MNMAGRRLASAGSPAKSICGSSSAGLILLGLVAAVACKQSPPAPAAEETPEAKHERACERFANEMAQTGLLAGQLVVTALDDDPDSASRGRSEMKSIAQKMRRDLFDKCMQWPEEVMECLPPLGILKTGCEERLLAAMEGATPAPEHVPPGPAPAWTYALEHEPRAIAVASDGTVIVVADALLGLREGKVVWRKEGDFEGWLVALPGDRPTWVAGVEDRVVALDPISGAERWSATLPGVPDAYEPELEPVRAHVKAATPLGDGLLVGDAEARFFRIDPPRCLPERKGGQGQCVTAEGALPDEMLESDTGLFVIGSLRYLWEDDVLRGFSADWRRQMSARAHDGLSQVAVAQARLVLVVDEDLVELDPTQCRGESEFAPSGWPQPGALAMGDECEECSAPPPGCRRWRAYVEDVTGDPPALLDDGAVVVHADGFSLALAQGEPRWKATTGGSGPLVTDGTRVFGFSTGLREDGPSGLFELAAADGELRWLTPLVADYELRLALAGGWLAAASEGTVTLLALPPA